MAFRLLCSALLLSAACLSPAMASVMTARSTGVITGVFRNDHEWFGAGLAVGASYSMTTSFDYSGLSFQDRSPAGFYHQVAGNTPWTATITMNGVTRTLAKTGYASAFIGNSTSRNAGGLDEIYASLSSWDGESSINMMHRVASNTDPFIGPVADLGIEQSMTVKPEDLSAGYTWSNFTWYDSSQQATNIWTKVYTFSVNVDEDASVPEPGSLLLFGIGAVGALALRRRK